MWGFWANQFNTYKILYFKHPIMHTKIIYCNSNVGNFIVNHQTIKNKKNYTNLKFDMTSLTQLQKKKINRYIKYVE